jgi:hypothetical protein
MRSTHLIDEHRANASNFYLQGRQQLADLVIKIAKSTNLPVTAFANLDALAPALGAATWT